MRGRDLVYLSSEAEAILDAVRQTSDMLGLRGFSPTTVSWQNEEYPGSRGARVVTPHFPVFEGEKLIISPILQRRVKPDNWGPILAPSLVFYKRLKRNYNVGALIRVLPGLLLFLGFLSFSYLSLPHPSSELIVGIVVVTIVLLVLGVYSVVQLGRSLVLRADSEAALVIGTEQLIQALRTLEVLRERDASRGNDWPEYGDHPTITKRIASLRNL